MSHTNLEGVAKIFEDKKRISREPYSSGDGGQTSADNKQDPEMSNAAEQNASKSVEQEQSIRQTENLEERFVLTEEDVSCMLLK